MQPKIQAGVFALLAGGQCALLAEARGELPGLRAVSPSRRVHCFLGKRNVFESELLLDLFQTNGFRVTFSPGEGAALDAEEIFHLANFLDGIRAHYERDDARRKFYRRWRDELLSAGRSDPRPADVTLPRARRPLPPLRALLWQLFQPGPEAQESARIGQAFTAGRTVALAGRACGERLLISGWYGTETLGDKAILGGVIAAARRVRPGLAIDVASLEPYVSRMTVRQMPDLGIARILSPSEARAAVAAGEYDTVAVGGGPLMSPIPWCTHLLELFADAKKAGAKTIVAGCGVGPLFVEHRNAAIKYLLELADEVILRDHASADRARRELGVARACAVALDPAFVWIQRHLPAAIERDPQQILLAVRDWPIEEFAAGMQRAHAEKLKAHYEAELVRMIRELLRLDPTLHIVPFCMHKYAAGGDDRAFYRRLLTNFPEILARLDHRHRTPLEDLQTISRSRVILAMRFHSVVFSLATRTPFLAVDYTLGGKTAGLLDDVGAGDRLVPIERFDGLDAAKRLLAAGDFVTDLSAKISETESILEQAFARIWAAPAP